MKKIVLNLLAVSFLVGCILCISATAYAGSATLLWQPNSEPDLAGYKAFVREKDQGYNYANPAWQGTETTCKIENLDDTKTYYFVVRAFDTEGYESGNSNEVSLVKGMVPDGLPPKDPKTVTITVTVKLPE
ncbi:MAG: fibronectin type III domain-containing protein [Deltaproteobacteria bacterium]|nr:fibronectin type III domain-containing protein [Deltaproteobacteria bacterium]